MPSFTLTIPDARFAVVKASLLEVFPIPIDNSTGENIIDPDTGLPYTENNWLKFKIKDSLIRLTKRGRRKFRLGEGEDAFRDEAGDFDDSFDIT